MNIYARRQYKKRPTKYDQRYTYYNYYKLDKVDGQYYWVRLFSTMYFKRHNFFNEYSTNIINNCSVDLINRNEQVVSDTTNQYYVIKFKETDLL